MFIAFLSPRRSSLSLRCLLSRAINPPSGQWKCALGRATMPAECRPLGVEAEQFQRGYRVRSHLQSITFLLVTAALHAMFASPSHAHSTPPSDCASSQAAAVQCIVANAVSTGLTQPRYGMTLAQFQDYGVAVTKILQTDQTYLVLVGLSSAIADALPPRNADGTFNDVAQNVAIAQIVAAAATLGNRSARSPVVHPGSSRRHERQSAGSADPHARSHIAHHRFLRNHRHGLGRHRKLAASELELVNAGGQFHRVRPRPSHALAHHRSD